MSDRLLRVGEVAGILGIAKPTVWLWDSQGKIPKSFKLTPATTVWRYSEIMAWIDEKQAETQDSEEDTVQIKNNGYIPKKREAGRFTKTEAVEVDKTPTATKQSRSRRRVAKRPEA